MRLILLFLLAIAICSCNSNTALTKREFAEIYLDSLKNRYPTASFELSPDLSIKAKKDELEFTHFVDNAYTAYKAAPNSIKEVIGRYLASTTELYTSAKKEIDINAIVPVVKPASYQHEADQLNKEGKPISMLTEKYNDQLIIAYAEDSKTNIKYLTEDNFKKLSIPKDSLQPIALRNFVKIIPDIQKQGKDGLFMITAGGDYEASLILLSSLWNKENMPVDGEFVVAIPTRDVLLVTGSNNKSAIDKMKGMVAELYKSGNYQVSEYLYKWNGHKFEKYQ